MGNAHRNKALTIWPADVGEFALYVSGRRRSYVKVASVGELVKRGDKERRLAPCQGRGALNIRLAQEPLARNARDVCDCSRLRAAVRFNRLHAGRIERLLIATISFALGRAGIHLDHLAAAFEKGAGLDHQ
jgi:hypothetical protein